MPKAKRRKNIFGFGRKSSGNYIPASGGIAKHAPKHRAKSSVESDSKYDDVARSLAGKPYSKLSSSQQATVRGVASKMNPRRKRKRNASLGLPANQFVNARVRMKGGKIQVMADERILGKAGFKAGAGLKGLSVSGGAKLNPKRKPVAKYTVIFQGPERNVSHTFYGTTAGAASRIARANKKNMFDKPKDWKILSVKRMS